eukprot:scaffold12641_cov71-Phaeocystis_antarctica.AAC.1
MHVRSGVRVVGAEGATATCAALNAVKARARASGHQLLRGPGERCRALRTEAAQRELPSKRRSLRTPARKGGANGQEDRTRLRVLRERMVIGRELKGKRERAVRTAVWLEARYCVCRAHVGEVVGDAARVLGEADDCRVSALDRNEVNLRADRIAVPCARRAEREASRQ